MRLGRYVGYLFFGIGISMHSEVWQDGTDTQQWVSVLILAAGAWLLASEPKE